MLQLRFGERGLNIVDHRNGNPDLLETSDRLGSGLRSECTLNQPSEFDAISIAVGVGRKPRIIDQFGQAQPRAKRRELAVVSDRDYDPTIRSVERLVRRQARMPLTGPAGRGSTYEIAKPLVDQLSLIHI